MAERYERASTIVISNLDFLEWDQAFPHNRLLARATLDRLRYNAYCRVLDEARPTDSPGCGFHSPVHTSKTGKITPSFNPFGSLIQ